MLCTNINKKLHYCQCGWGTEIADGIYRCRVDGIFRDYGNMRCGCAKDETEQIEFVFEKEKSEEATV